MRRVRRWLALQMLAAAAFALSNCSLVIDTSGFATQAARDSEDGSPHDADDESIGVDISDDASDGADVPEPPAFLSPSTESGTMTVARDGVWTLAALDPTVVLTAQISVGSSTSSAAGVGSLALTLTEGASISWHAGASSVEHTFSVFVNTALQNNLGFIVNSAQFVGTGRPIHRVSPGATVPLWVSVQFWSQSDCPTCIDQLVFGIDTPTTCISGVVGAWPGVTAEGTFSFSAPTEPAIYKIRGGIIQQEDCIDALATATLSPVELALLIVE